METGHKPVWCPLVQFPPLVERAEWFSKLPRRRSIVGFEELRRGIPLKFYFKGRSVPRTLTRIARVKQRQRGSPQAPTSSFKRKPPPRTTERYSKQVKERPGDNPIEQRVAVGTTTTATRAYAVGSRILDWSPGEEHQGREKINKGARGKKDAPRDKADTIIWCSMGISGKTKQKVSQNFSMDSGALHNTWRNFLVISIYHRPYNGFIGRPGISAIRAVPSTAYGMLKFPINGGIITIYNTAAPPKECNTVTCDVTQTQRQHATKVTNLLGGIIKRVLLYSRVLCFYLGRERCVCEIMAAGIVVATLQRKPRYLCMGTKTHGTGVPAMITEHKLKIRQGYSQRHVPRLLIEPDGSRRCGCPEKYIKCHPTSFSAHDEKKSSRFLNGKFSSLNRFLSKSADKSLPLVQTTLSEGVYEEGRDCSVGTTEAERSFHAINKHYLAHFPR
ncbi:hypothetical protein Tco_1074025 [Tanacetum coccineum]